MYGGENEKINAEIHPSLKLIILRSIITLTSDHKRSLTLTHTCPGSEARVHVSGSMCWSITDLRINNWVIVSQMSSGDNHDGGDQSWVTRHY